MSCNPLHNPTCLLPPIGGPVVGSVLDAIDRSLGGGIRWIVVNTTSWWIQLPSPDLSGAAVTRIQAWLLPVTVAVAVGGLIAGGLRMAITRRANPMLDAGGGLLTMAAAVTVGTAIPLLLSRAGDEWSTWVLRASSGGQFQHRLEALLNFDGKAAPAVVLVLSLAAIVMALIQAVLMLFRQVSLLILAGVLPLAAAGAAAPLTKPWIRKVSSWMLALIFYKPAAAAVYATAFTLVGSGRNGITVLLGFVTLLLSVFMLPALMRFFTWTTGSIGSAGGGGGGQLLSTAAVGAVAVGALRSGANGAGSAALDQASYMDSRLGPAPGGSPPAGPGPGPASPTPGSQPPQAANTSPSATAPSGGMATTMSAPPGASATAAPAATATGTTTAATAGAAEASTAAASGAAATAATGAAAAAGPVGIAVAGAVQTGQAAVQATTRLARGAMEPDEGNDQ